MMDKCKECGQSILFACEDNVVYVMCGCGTSIPEPDPLAIAHEQLAECYATLAMLCHANIGNDERATIRALFDKHQTKYNAS